MLVKVVKWIRIGGGAAVLILLIGLLYHHLSYKSLYPQESKYRTAEILAAREGLVGYWPLNSISNDKIQDESGNKIHGEIVKGFNFNEPKVLLSMMIKLGYNYWFGRVKEVKGVKGNAIELNGRQWISCDNIDLYNVDKFTISLWVWREGPDIDVPTIMGKGSWPFHNGWWLCTTPNSKYIDMGIAWGKGWKHIESGYELPYQEWHHLAVTMDNVQHEIAFFVDGIKFGSTHENVPTWLSNWSHDMFIGDFDGSGSWPWFGKIDEVYFFNRILSKEDVNQLFLDVKRGY